MDRELQRALKEHGNEGVVFARLRDGTKRLIAGRKVVRVDGDRAAQEIYVTPRGRGKADIFAEKKGNGKSVFGGKSDKQVIREGDLRKTLETVGNAEIRAVYAQRAGLRG